MKRTWRPEDRQPWEAYSRGDSNRKLSKAEWDLLFSLARLHPKAKVCSLFGVTYRAYKHHKRKRERWEKFGTLKPASIDLTAAIRQMPHKCKEQE